jgi:c-di-GMP-binding flagellar brake protein YcgR
MHWEHGMSAEERSDHSGTTGTIPLGLGTPLTLRVAGVRGRLASTLVGLEVDCYLIVKMPRVPGVESKMFLGNQVTVLAVCFGTVYGFRTRIINYVKAPDRLVFLSYPETIEKKRLRAHDRLACKFPAVVRIDKGQEEHKGIILDVGMGGCRLAIGTPALHCHVGDSLSFASEFLRIEQSSPLLAEIRNMDQDGAKIAFGVQFSNSSPDAVSRVAGYISRVAELLNPQVNAAG